MLHDDVPLQLRMRAVCFNWLANKLMGALGDWIHALLREARWALLFSRGRSKGTGYIFELQAQLVITRRQQQGSNVAFNACNIPTPAA